MGDEEEEGITVYFGSESAILSCSQANDASFVTATLGLYYQPAYVEKKNSGKRVEFGELQDGFTYKIPESNKIPNQKKHTQNAVILSEAVYEEDSLGFLTNSSKNHSVKVIHGITMYSKQKVLVAVGDVGNEDTLYVVFRGSKSRDDFMADIDIKQTEKKNFPGLYHSGFEERSQTVSSEYILECAEETGCRNIVTCGHSLGGSVSSIVALDLMRRGDQEEVRIYNITFGSPFFGNEDVQKMCKAEKFARNILHYVDYRDIVPGLLSLGHTTYILKNQNIKLTGKDSESKCHNPKLNQPS